MGIYRTWGFRAGTLRALTVLTAHADAAEMLTVLRAMQLDGAIDDAVRPCLLWHAS